MKRINRKDLARMATRQVLAAAREPYGRLARYLRPYKARFALGIFFGLLAGATNGLLVFTTRHVGDLVLTRHDDAAGTATIAPAFQLPAWFPFQQNISRSGQAQAAAEPPDEAAKWSHQALNSSPAETADAFAKERTELPMDQVIWICAMLPLFMMVRGILGYLNAYCMQWVSIKTLDDIRQDVFSNVLAQSQEFFNKQKVGDLIQTVFNQTRMAQMALTQIASDVVKQPVAILAALTAMLLTDWRFTLLSFTFFPLCVIPVLIIGKRIRQSGNQEEEEAGVLMNVMHEALGGIRVVKAHGREEYEAARFSAANKKMLRLMMRWRKAMELTGPIVEATAAVGIAAALVYAWRNHMTPGQFFALNGGLILMYEPAKSLGRLHIMLQKCLAATTKIFELMDRRPGVMDAPDAARVKRARGEIEFRGVNFSYGRKLPAVRDINLVIPAGSTCALVGHSGAGKSTLVSLLMRFYDPGSGAILLDGIDLRALTQKSLRQQIGIVNQDIFLFHDTIYENIRYGKLAASEADIETAAHRAFAHEFILEQPNGYQTVVGDKGCNLSGGQRQRICIARAILRNAPVLILDEATSALDSESEAKIQTALDDLSKNKTVIAIAHRLSTILRANQIVVMQEGSITDTGTHAELLERSEVYQRLYRMQFEHGSPVVAST
ncbi:MAG: ABC transporter ATP-binding protein [Verrucomicrobiales bacterium]